MSIDFSISLNGVSAAEQNLNQASRRIATATPPSSGEPLKDSVSMPDFAAEMFEVNQAKTAVEANLKVISTQQELEHDTLNLFA
jgi:hypothetical protein